MKFGPVALDQAEGAILAHSLSLPGGRLRKGVVLTAAHIASMGQAGLREVTVARLDPDDVHEDAAAKALAAALVPLGTGLELRDVGTGRANILATDPGVVQIDEAAIRAANEVDPMITIATVPNWQQMDPGGMVATVKIISYAVPDSALHAASLAATDALQLCGAARRRVGLIVTTVPGGKIDPNPRAIAARVDRLGAQLTPPRVVAHDQTALATALHDSDEELVLILTASATSDIHDVAPAALKQAGGTVTHFGMPVDPGNLLFIGDLAGRPVIGLPGCARSPALNGADWVLSRVICGVDVTASDIMAMGVGGLLKEIPSRPQPRRGGQG